MYVLRVGMVGDSLKRDVKKDNKTTEEVRVVETPDRCLVRIKGKSSPVPSKFTSEHNFQS